MYRSLDLDQGLWISHDKTCSCTVLPTNNIYTFDYPIKTASDKKGRAFNKIMKEREVVGVTYVYRGQFLGAVGSKASHFKPDKPSSAAYHLLAMQPK